MAYCGAMEIRGYYLKIWNFKFVYYWKQPKLDYFFMHQYDQVLPFFSQISFSPRPYGSQGLKKSRKIFGKQKISWFWHIEKKKIHKINWCLFLTSLKSLLAPKREDRRINTKAALTRINTFKDGVTVSRFPSKSQDLWDLEDF